MLGVCSHERRGSHVSKWILGPETSKGQMSALEAGPRSLGVVSQGCDSPPVALKGSHGCHTAHCRHPPRLHCSAPESGPGHALESLPGGPVIVTQPPDCLENSNVHGPWEL